MTSGDPLHRESRAWVRTIDEGKGYTAIDAASYRKLLKRMPSYAFYKTLVRHVYPGQAALEAGCGWALSSFALAAKEVSVTAVDISDKLVADLQRVQAELDGPYTRYLHIVTRDIFRLAKFGKTFDVVFSDGTYEHFLKDDDRRTILTNIQSILKPEGKFIVAVPNLHNPFFRMVVDQRMPDMRWFTVESLASELREGGFTVLATGFSFVNPGFAQWVRARWMIAAVRVVDVVFRFLPKPLKKIFAAHVFCVAVK